MHTTFTHGCLLMLAFILFFNYRSSSAFQPGELSPAYIRLKNFAMSNGLPGETVRTVYQDKEGYIWLGIESKGLCRFNGIQFDIFGHITNDSTSLSSDFIEVISEDKNGNLWIATDFGLNKLQKDLVSMSLGKRFTQYFHYETDTTTIPGNTLNALLKDSKGDLWIGTNAGLCKLNDDGNTFQTFHFKLNSFDKKKIHINAIYEDIKSNLWLGTNEGLFLLSKERKLLAFWNTSNSNLNNDQINTVCIDKNGMIWLGTQSGINVFDRGNNSFNHLIFSDRASYMHFAGINKIKKASDEKLWIGSFSNGLLIYDIQSNSYQYFNSQDKNPDGTE